VAARVRLWFQRPDVEVEQDRPPELLLKAGGALVDPTWEANEASRCRERERSAAAASAARNAQASEAAKRMAEHQRAQIAHDIEVLRRNGIIP
jgi:hypothetical protein